MNMPCARRILTAVLTALALCSPFLLLTNGNTAHAAEESPLIEINEANFPDANFRAAVLSSYSDGSGHADRQTETMNVSDMHIGDLTGIEYFDGLRWLWCGDNQLTSLDVSHNTRLEALYCNQNQLTSLNVSGNTALTLLHCGDNQIAVLDLAQNTALEYLYCYGNQLTSLNVAQNTALNTLRCYGNQLAALDLSNNQVLMTLICSNNPLGSLDVTGNSVLKYLECTDTRLTSLDVTRNPELAELSCSGNRLQSLDLSHNEKLTSLMCTFNELASLDVTRCTELSLLYCYVNRLPSLDVSHNAALRYLWCYQNQLTSLDVSGNGMLDQLACNDNLLQTLAVSGNPELTLFQCGNNHLTSLDLSGNAKLTFASVSDQQYGPFAYTQSGGAYLVDLKALPNGGQIDTARVTMTDGGVLNASTGIVTYSAPPSTVAYRYDTRNAAAGEALMSVTLRRLPLVKISAANFPDPNFRAAALAHYSDGYGYVDASVTQIAVLDQDISDLTGIAHYPALSFLVCDGNPLLSLDASGAAALEFLECVHCQLTSLDVTKNGTLDTLVCDDNALQSLDVTGNAALWGLSCAENRLTALDLSKNTALEILICGDNRLASLDVSGNADLKELNCGNNRLTSLDLTGNTQLTDTSLAVQSAGPLVYTLSGGAYQVDLTQLPFGNLIDIGRVTMTDGGQLDVSNGIVSYSNAPADVTYDYDTHNPGSGDALLPVTVSVSAPEADPGDANEDGSVDIMDLVVIVDYIVNGNAPASMAGADANGDGTVDIMDLVFIINLIVNPPANSGARVDAAAGNTVSVEVPFYDSSPITALELTYTLSPGLTFVSAECAGMTGAGGDTGAIFVTLNGGATAGIVTLTVRVQDGITENQSVNVTAVTGANTAGPRAVGSPQTYIIDVNASGLAILTQPIDTTVSVGNTATFTVEAAGPEPLAYQWYVNTNTGVGWMAVAGATESAYTTDAVVIGDDGFRYFCRVNAGEPYIDSAIATITVVVSPRTGDGSHPVRLIALLLLAAAGLILAISRRQRQRMKSSPG